MGNECLFQSVCPNCELYVVTTQIAYHLASVCVHVCVQVCVYVSCSLKRYSFDVFSLHVISPSLVGS